MKKSEVFADILSTVSIETEIPEDVIISKNRSVEVVDARYILVKMLYDAGLYPAVIAGLLNRTTSGIRYMLSDFEYRIKLNKYLAMTFKRIREQLENNC